MKVFNQQLQKSMVLQPMHVISSVGFFCILTPFLLPAFFMFKLCAQHHSGYKERLTYRLRKDDRET